MNHIGRLTTCAAATLAVYAFCGIKIADAGNQKSDAQACALGYKVMAVGRAIKEPTTPEAMRAITDLGNDSRYYLMVRGWLAGQLQGGQSIVAAAGIGEYPAIEARIAFLKEAIRRIDLE